MSALAGRAGACYHPAAFRPSSVRPKAEMVALDTADNADRLKREAAARALEFVRPGMRLGLGTGSTAAHFVELLGERVRGALGRRDPGESVLHPVPASWTTKT